jgi:hypothetical protein
MPATPQFVPLPYARDKGVYCELCKEEIRPGDLVAWWRVPNPKRGTRAMRVTAYCATCHWSNVREGRPLR